MKHTPETLRERTGLAASTAVASIIIAIVAALHAAPLLAIGMAVVASYTAWLAFVFAADAREAQERRDASRDRAKL